MTASDPSDREGRAANDMAIAPAAAGFRAQHGATIHHICNPLNPSINAIVSVARRLQEVLIQHGALPECGPFPFPELAPTRRA